MPIEFAKADVEFAIRAEQDTAAIVKRARSHRQCDERLRRLRHAIAVQLKPRHANIACRFRVVGIPSGVAGHIKDVHLAVAAEFRMGRDAE